MKIAGGRALMWSSKIDVRGSRAGCHSLRLLNVAEGIIFPLNNADYGSRQLIREPPREDRYRDRHVRARRATRPAVRAYSPG